MKKIIYVILFCFMYILNISAQTNKYVNLLQTVNNPITKSGWNLVFHDELNGSKDPMWLNGYCWGNTGAPYDNRDENYNQTSTSLQLITKKEDYTKPGYNVLKHYTSAMLNSDPCNGLDTTQYYGADGARWLYGYFEIRCKNPKSQLMWPAFWFFGEPNSKSYWNEVDMFEFGTGDGLVMTNHYNPTPDDETHQAIAKWIYALPGQTFGDTWVTYALKWEPNKLIWYINNKPVRIETEHVPNVAMRLKVGSGMGDLYTPFDLNLPANFPNIMDIDYVRVYQRSNYNNADPVFTINNQTSYISQTPVFTPFSSGLPIYLDGSQSYMPNNYYFLSIQRCDQNGVLSGTEAMDWLNSTELANINKLDIKTFASAHGLTMSQGRYYRIKLVGSPWVEVNQYIFTTTCTSNISFKVNGYNNTSFPSAISIPYNFGKPRIIMDASNTTSCNNSFFISLQKCTSNGTGIGTEISKYLSPSEKDYISYFDIEYFAQQKNFKLTNGSYYRLKVAVGPTWTEKVQIIKINQCTTNILYKINNSNNSIPTAINITNGQDIILDGSASNLCNNNYFFSIQECNYNCTVLYGNELIEERPYVGYDSQNKIYYYDIGKFDIRDFCRKNNFDLGCDKYYKVKLASGTPWVEESKLIYITPCSSYNNLYQVNGVDASTYYFGDPSLMSITLYAPQSMSCNESYFISVTGGLPSTEAMDWLTFEEIYKLRTLGNFDLINFAKSHGLTLKNNSTYYVKLVAGTGTCNADGWVENIKTIYFGTGSGKTEMTDTEESEDVISEINVYPNPTSDKFIISLPEKEDNIVLNLIDFQGRSIRKIETNKQLEVMDVSDLLPGIYILQINSENNVVTKKVQIIR